MKYKVFAIVAVVLAIALAAVLALRPKEPKVGVEYHPKGTRGGPMFFVPAGEFMMGRTTDESKSFEAAEAAEEGEDKKKEQSDEEPYHKVLLSAFYVDKFEVTVQDYAACAQEGKCSAPDSGGYCNWGMPDRSNHPINCVDWSQANAFCGWAGKRLPTEAQWEKAARGTDARLYPWGNETGKCDLAVMGPASGCGGPDTSQPVGSKPKGVGPYGTMDMGGNVWEWVSDWYDLKYYQSSPAKNPEGPASGKIRVIRGGAWSVSWGYMRTAYRTGVPPESKSGYIGFRCVKLH